MADRVRMASFPRIRRIPQRTPDTRLDSLGLPRLRLQSLARRHAILGHHRILRLHQHPRQQPAAQIRRLDLDPSRPGLLRHSLSPRHFRPARESQGGVHDLYQQRQLAHGGTFVHGRLVG